MTLLHGISAVCIGYSNAPTPEPPAPMSINRRAPDSPFHSFFVAHNRARNPSEKTHYQILSVSEDASYDEIRGSYRSLLLIFHPGKIHGKCGIGDEMQEDFVKVQKAWEVLSDSKLRARYDHELNCARHASEIAEDVDLEEMSTEDIDGRMEFFYPCRCGDCFLVTSEELEEMGLPSDLGNKEGKQLEDIKADKASVLLHCGSCSLKIRLMVRLCP